MNHSNKRKLTTHPHDLFREALNVHGLSAPICNGLSARAYVLPEGNPSVRMVRIQLRGNRSDAISVHALTSKGESNDVDWIQIEMAWHRKDGYWIPDDDETDPAQQLDSIAACLTATVTAIVRR